MHNIDYSDFDDFCRVAGITLSISEIHGFMTGYMCSNRKTSSSERRRLYWDLITGDYDKVGSLEDEIVSKLDVLFNSTLEQLDEFGDYQFRILMPKDEENINQRMRALRAFCAGFLGALGSVALNEEVSEVLVDIQSIAAVRDEMEETEDNESDFFQLVEFVRASVFFVFFEIATSN